MEPVVREHKPRSQEFALWAPVEELLEEEGYRVESWELITSLASTQCSRATFKLRLEEGDRLKARVFANLERAERYRRFRPSVKAELSPFLFGKQKVIVERWVDGQQLSLNPQNLRRAAELLAQIHRSRGWESVPGERWAEQYLKQLEFVRTHELISAPQFSQLAGMASLLSGVSVEVGLVHYDFCGENLIVDKDGRLWSVDNEHLQLGPLELDLARSWFRWPMPQNLWEHFYGEFQTLVNSELREFWQAFALLESLAIRAEWKVPSSPRALQLLENLLEKQKPPTRLAKP